MRDLLILALIAAAGYLAYDDYYKQRPALEQAHAEIQQLRENLVYVPANPSRQPAWFQKHLDESSSSLNAPRRDEQRDTRTSPPQP